MAYLRPVGDFSVFEIGERGVRFEHEGAKRRTIRTRDGVTARVLHVEQKLAWWWWGVVVDLVVDLVVVAAATVALAVAR